MIKEFNISTNKTQKLIDITQKVKQTVEKSTVNDGKCIVYCPHTTAAITINENADPDVKKDILNQLNEIIPKNNNYKHKEGNSHAHIKSSIIGASETILISDGKLSLGTWQGIYFCEFDGPRKRKCLVKVNK